MQNKIFKIRGAIQFLLSHPFHFIQWLRCLAFPRKKETLQYATDVIYAGTFKPDAEKDIIALRKYKPNLHCTALVSARGFSPMKFFVFRHFDRVTFFKDQNDLKNILHGYKAKSLVFQGGDDNPYIISAAEWPGRFVWQVRDTNLRTPRAHLNIATYERAKTIAERADAIITFHKKEGWDALKNEIKFRGEIVSIPPLCVPEIGPRYRKPKLSRRDAELHIVYAGGVSPSQGSVAGKITYTHAAFFEKFKIIADQKIHIHVYSPHLDFYTDSYRDYFRLERGNPYFHIEKTVPFDQLLIEYTQYDWAIMHVTWQSEFLNPGFDGPIQNGLMGPVQSGIPIVVSPTALGNAEMIKRFNRGIIVDEKDIANLKEVLAVHKRLVSRCEHTKLENGLLYDWKTFGSIVLPASL